MNYIDKWLLKLLPPDAQPILTNYQIHTFFEWFEVNPGQSAPAGLVWIQKLRTCWYIHRLHRQWKIFSDCELQFAAWYMRALYKHFGIETGLTTTYHPEGNGKVKRKN